jgi:uncharacterized coiled-coil DUF342 family protein
VELTIEIALDLFSARRFTSTMEDLQKEQVRLAQMANYSKAIDQVQEMIDLLKQTRESITSNPSTTGIQLAKLKQPVKKSFDKANDNLKEVHSALKDYSKVLDKVSPTDPIVIQNMH